MLAIIKIAYETSFQFIAIIKIAYETNFQFIAVKLILPSFIMLFIIRLLLYCRILKFHLWLLLIFTLAFQIFFFNKFCFALTTISIIKCTFFVIRNLYYNMQSCNSNVNLLRKKKKTYMLKTDLQPSKNGR